MDSIGSYLQQFNFCKFSCWFYNFEIVVLINFKIVLSVYYLSSVSLGGTSKPHDLNRYVSKAK